MRKQLSGLFKLALVCQLVAIGCLHAQTGKWTALKNLPPHFNMGVCLLMTDGTVICHNASGGGNGTGWDRLTPDIHGSYANGTWDSIASMNNDRLFFSSQVLPSGKVYVAGGEYGAGGTNGELYDPVTNKWTLCGPIPSGWNVYDGNSEILFDGTVLEGPQIGSATSYNILIWDPATMQYTTEPNSIYNHDEAEWIKLPDSSVMFVGIASQNANRYIPQTATWVTDASTPGDLYDPYGEEAGCALMLPNGKAIFFGATPYNAIYTPSGNSSPGTWISADSFPVIQGTLMGQPDAAGAMMVNGHILLAVSPIGTGPSTEFNSPAYFVEYDYTTNTFTQVKDTIPGQHGDSIHYIASYQTQMLDLPDGNVLVSISQTDTLPNQYYIYTPGSSPIPQGKPTIDNVIPDSCFRYKITGKLFNGISEGAAYGDDWQMSTNWPLVRLTSGTNVYYAKTTNWNRIGAVQTDSAEDTAYFTLPSLPGGTYSLQVVVNGFASSPVPFTTFGVAITNVKNITVCHGTGSATASASHGTAPYTYLWSPSGGTDSIASNLSAGTYTVTVTEFGGCSATAKVTLTQSETLTLSQIVIPDTCMGGSDGMATVNVSGGVAPYTYSWSNGGTTATINGLTNGTYSVSVSDSCGYYAVTSVNITQPTVLTVTIDSVNEESCGGDSTGSAIANVSGGRAPFTYSWSPTGGTNANVYGLSSGTYTVTVTDFCGSVTTASMSITQPPTLYVRADSVNVTSKVGCNGIANAIVTGGVPPYTYYWTPGGQTTAVIRGQCAGTYCCAVTDNTGCTKNVCIVINDEAGINEVSAGGNNVEVFPNPNNGEFQLKISNYAFGVTNTVEVYNMLGQKVYSTSLSTQHSALNIDLGTKPAGIYLYRVVSESGRLVGEGKFVIN